jgi:hypothetical protein
MFFYLIQNSTLIEKELDKNTKITKIFLYGGISYIILHATLFIGGKDALLNSLKGYFWLFFILDISMIIITNNKDIDLNNIIILIKNKLLTANTPKKQINQKKSLESIIKKPSNNYRPLENIKKTVKFVEESEYTSDSDSDIGTDIDFEEFQQSLNL